jgi:hypothetical protein
VADFLSGGSPFLGSQSRDLGYSRQQFRQALAEGEVRRVLRNVYVDAQVPDSTDLRIAALHLVMPTYAVLFGSTAMWARSIDAFQPDQRFTPVPQCVVPHGATKVTARGVHTVEGYLDPSDVTELNGLRMTTPVRTTVDGLRRLRAPFALSAADAMAHAGWVSRDEVTDRIHRLRGYPGIVQARRLAHLVDPATESPGESWTKLRLVEAGCPIPKAQLKVTDKKGRVAYLDLGYDAAHVGCEYDGREVHTLAADVADDLNRRSWLRDVLGWRIAVARKETVFGLESSFDAEVALWLGLTPPPRQVW